MRLISAYLDVNIVPDARPAIVASVVAFKACCAVAFAVAAAVGFARCCCSSNSSDSAFAAFGCYLAAATLSDAIVSAISAAVAFSRQAALPLLLF